MNPEPSSKERWGFWLGSTVGFVPVPPHPVRPGKERGSEGEREGDRESEREVPGYCLVLRIRLFGFECAVQS